ncbi:MAG UNVERIFIED_CONTAM: SDR family NAD(P)-dependent oxidoreductase [Rickettsiaceae bacterium]|jgi:short-subunit dehydrogenase
MKKIWLIGASEGIGRALAIELSQKGYFLYLSARNREKLEMLEKELGNNAIPIPLDVSDIKSIQQAYEQIKKDGGIDTLIYGAAVYKPMSATNIDIEICEQMVDINLTGAIRVLSYIIPDFIRNKNGHIALIGSVASYIGLPNSFGYGCTKAGLLHLAENLKCDLEDSNIKVQIINPGFVQTRLTNMNDFYMPFIISPETAANYIVNILHSNKFDSRFPFLFPNFIKIISNLPYFLYFAIAKIIKPKK